MLVGTPLGRFIITDPNRGTDLDMTLRAALAPGVVPAYNPANPTGPGSPFKNFTTADRFNFQPFNYVATPSERLGMFATIEHEFADNLHFSGKATYVNRRSANQAAPLPLFVGPDAGNGNLLDQVTIDLTNPFNPFGFDLEAGTLAFIGRRLVEAGPRHYEQDVNTFNITGTLAGDFAALDRNWFWDVNAVWSRNTAEQTFTGNVNAQRVQQALGPVAQCTGAANRLTCSAALARSRPTNSPSSVSCSTTLPSRNSAISAPTSRATSSPCRPAMCRSRLALNAAKRKAPSSPTPSLPLACLQIFRPNRHAARLKSTKPMSSSTSRS